MKKKVVLWIAMMTLKCVTMFAATFNVSGTVVEKTTGEAVASATIQLLSLPDSSFVEGVTTGSMGEFTFKNVKEGEYTMRISFIGYTTKYVKLDLNAQKKKEVNVGYITMTTDDILLRSAEGLQCQCLPCTRGLHVGGTRQATAWSKGR